MDRAFQVFVERAVEQLRTDAKGRSDKMRELRDRCTEFLGAQFWVHLLP